MSDTYETLKGKITAVAELTPKADKAEELLNIVLQSREHGRNEEPGCLQFDVSKSGNQVITYEIWENAEALDNHRNWLRGVFGDPRTLVENYVFKFYEPLD